MYPHVQEHNLTDFKIFNRLFTSHFMPPKLNILFLCKFSELLSLCGAKLKRYLIQTACRSLVMPSVTLEHD